MSGESMKSMEGERAEGDISLDEWREDAECEFRGELGSIRIGERLADTEFGEGLGGSIERRAASLIEDFGMGFNQGFGQMRWLRELVLPEHADSWFSAHVTAALARNGYPNEANEVVKGEIYILEDEHKAIARFGIAEGYARQDEIEEAHIQLELAHLLSGGFSEGDLETLNSAYDAVFQARLRELGIPTTE